MRCTTNVLKGNGKQASFVDLDTGLPNEYGFLRITTAIIQNGDITNYDGIFFDIARMSRINIKYGQAGGDAAIHSYLAILQTALAPDEILGRCCGDRFLALIQKKNRKHFLNLLMDVPAVLQHGGEYQTVRISAVAGVYEIRTDTITAEEILTNMSRAVSYAKHVVHRPYIIMDAELEEELNRRQKLEEEILWGLRHKEFVPFYQPKVDTNTNTIIGAEALARWHHDGQFISPGIFIPIMEQNNTIADLDFYILDQVCSDLKEWISHGISPVEISVNFSRANLSDPDLAYRIHDVIAGYDIPDHMIQIELTETINETSLSRISELLEQLHAYGITSAIDDFGSGSSSITLLKYAHFNDLKIDKSFVGYANDMEKQLLKDIIRMAKNMKMNVIAEGVERKEQISELNQMDCFKMQGYYFGKPMEKDRFAELWLANNTAA